MKKPIPDYSLFVNTLAYISDLKGGWKMKEWKGATGIYSNGKLDALVEQDESVLCVQFDGFTDVQYIDLDLREERT